MVQDKKQTTKASTASYTIEDAIKVADDIFKLSKDKKYNLGAGGCLRAGLGPEARHTGKPRRRTGKEDTMQDNDWMDKTIPTERVRPSGEEPSVGGAVPKRSHPLLVWLLGGSCCWWL